MAKKAKKSEDYLYFEVPSDKVLVVTIASDENPAAEFGTFNEKEIEASRYTRHASFFVNYTEYHHNGTLLFYTVEPVERPALEL